MDVNLITWTVECSLKQPFLVKRVFNDAFRRHVVTYIMGNSQTEEPDNPNFNMAEYNQKMRNTSIYSNATLNPTAAQVYQAEQPKQFNVSQIEKKKLETKFAFFKDSLKIVQKP